jgi:hypothetical protein
MAVIYIKPSPTDPLVPYEPENPTDPNFPGAPVDFDRLGNINIDDILARVRGKIGTRVIHVKLPSKQTTNTEDIATAVPFVTIGLVAAFIFVLVKKRKPHVRN